MFRLRVVARVTPGDRFMKTRAFTLIELLVVIAIIVALLAILLPSMSQAMAVAESAVCRSNQKQIGVAFGAYLFDHRQTYPAYRFAENTSATTTGTDIQYHWFDQLRRKLTSDGEVPDDFALYRCPSDEEYAYSGDRISYGYNYTNFGDVFYATKVQPTLMQVSQPAETILTGDSVGIYSGTNKFWGSVISPLDINVIGGPAGAHNNYRLNPRHPNGTASILFVDGHAGGHDADELNQQIRGTATAYWWDVNEGDRYLYHN